MSEVLIYFTHDWSSLIEIEEMQSVDEFEIAIEKRDLIVAQVQA
jgi:hypothetical protein